MSTLVLTPSRLSGSVRAEASKSVLHRAVIAAALADGTSFIAPVSACDDIQATVKAVQTLGLAEVRTSGKGVSVRGGLRGEVSGAVDCIASASTLRFLLPLAAMRDGAVFTGEPSLFERPMKPYAQALQQGGAQYHAVEGGLSISGGLKPGGYNLPGNISSQFITGMLMALPLLDGPSELHIDGPLESQPYVEMTLATLQRAGITIRRPHDRAFYIAGKQAYQPMETLAPGDWSQAAFFLSMGALGADIAVKGLSRNDLQGDRIMLSLIRNMGAKAAWQDDALCVNGAAQRPIEMDARQTPDLVPAVAAIACGLRGTTRILNVGRLRMKETDRVETIADSLHAIGAATDTRSDELIIHGSGTLRGGETSAYGDHRIAMMLAVASTLCEKPVKLTDWQCVSKSAPTFWDDFRALGGRADEQ